MMTVADATETPQDAGTRVVSLVTPDTTTSRIALLGNPNTGKTTLFNRMCGLRAKTANFPGITVEARVGQATFESSSGTSTKAQIVDLPGVYQLSLQLPESELCRKVLDGEIEQAGQVGAVLVVVDTTNLVRNLRLVAEAKEHGRPLIVALNMIDIAQRRGLTIDADKLSERIGSPCISICAKSGSGVAALNQVVGGMLTMDEIPITAPLKAIPPVDDSKAIVAWAEDTVADCVGGHEAIGSEADSFTDRLDAAFTHPVLGIGAFALIMAGLFWVIYQLAAVPMDMIDSLFGAIGAWVASAMPEGLIRDALVDGVIGGVGSVVIFLPQICLLFFLISILEDTGYLARAAFVMDRLLCRFGLPGHAFVPLLSSHACAIPGIMSTKLIPDRKDRMATIFVAPFMSCAARVPVYVLLIGILFTDKPMLAGLAFFGCYILGAIVAMVTAMLMRRTLLPGKSRPMVLELPSYKMPSIRSAVYTTIDRGIVFLKNAGTTILLICIVLWWLSAFPKVNAPAEAMTLRTQAEAIVEADADGAAALNDEADLLEAKHAQANSYAGKLGHVLEPVFRPLGYDWRLSVGVLTSFAAREVFASTMGVLVSGSDDVEDEGVLHRISSATRDDGTPLFTTATSASLLVFFVLAMQCLPTLAVTKRETGSWKWAGLQLGYMSLVAYIFAFITYQGLQFVGA